MVQSRTLLLLSLAVGSAAAQWCEDDETASKCCSSDNSTSDCESQYDCTCPGGLDIAYVGATIGALVFLICLCSWTCCSSAFRPVYTKVRALDDDEATDEATDEADDEADDEDAFSRTPSLSF